MIDLKTIHDACNRVGAWLLADVFQGVGAIPFQMSDYPGIICVTGTQKWLCGPLSLGVLAFSDERFLELNPVLVGAMTFGGSDQTIPDQKPVQTAARFEPGSALVLSAVGSAESIRCIEEMGVENIRQTNIILRDRLITGLDKIDAEILGQRDSRRSGSHVTFRPRLSVEECAKNLAQKKISHVTKVGGIRLSPHAFNTAEEIDLALECLK